MERLLRAASASIRPRSCGESRTFNWAVSVHFRTRTTVLFLHARTIWGKIARTEWSNKWVLAPSPSFSHEIFRRRGRHERPQAFRRSDGVRLRGPTMSRLRFQPRQLGFETLNSDERIARFFQTQREAATAVMRGNHERSISRNR